MNSFFRELKRRNVYKVAVAYAVVGWLLVQIATQTFPFFDIPHWAIRLVILLVVIGFPIALIIAWAFELTPEGVKRTESLETPRKQPGGRVWIYVVIAGGLLSVGLFFLGRYTAPRMSSNEDGRPGGPSLPKSIAVLPFENRSEDKANAYFADGIQDEILTRLAKIADLKVISRTSTQRYKSSPENLPEIAKQLGVEHVLEGSVQKAGEQVRVTVQLIKAATDAHLWAETYDRKLSDIFQVESDIAQRIASALEAKLTGRERRDISSVGTTNAAAYDAYLRGLALDHSQSDSEVEQARQFFERAVELDPKFALAWAALANRESWKYFAAHRTPQQLARARQAAETAVNLQPEASETHAGAGSFYYYCLQDFDRALSELSQARERAPGNSTAILLIGMVKRRQGKLDESIQLLHEAANLDPLNNDVWMNLARSYRGVRKFKDARAMFDRALAVSPGDVGIKGEKLETYLGEGDLKEAERALQDLPVDFRNRAFDNYITFLLFQREFQRALETITKQLKDNALDPEESFLASLEIALLQTVLGKGADARPTIEEARRKLEARRGEGDMSLEISDTLLVIAAALNDRNAVEKEAKALLTATSHDLWRLPHTEEVIARAYAFLGDADRALPHIERALGMPSQEGLTPAYLRLHPVWDKIRSDPRFQQLANQKP